jgi:hypothetical protein
MYKEKDLSTSTCGTYLVWNNETFAHYTITNLLSPSNLCIVRMQKAYPMLDL